jgi:hypothetical protein
MEVICSTEMFGTLQTTWHYNQEGYNLHPFQEPVFFTLFSVFLLFPQISNLLLYRENGEGTSEILATVYKIMLYHIPTKSNLWITNVAMYSLSIVLMACSVLAFA